MRQLIANAVSLLVVLSGEKHAGAFQISLSLRSNKSLPPPNVLHLKARPGKDEEGDLKARLTSWIPPSPEIDDFSLVLGDALAFLAVAQVLALIHIVASPNFPGWFSPVKIPSNLGETFNNGSRLASLWLLAGLNTNAWTESAASPYLGAGNALKRAMRSMLDFSNVVIVVTLLNAAGHRSPVDLSNLVLTISASATVISAWRLLYSQRSGPF